MDVEHGFEPRYEVIEGKKKLISELKQAAKTVEASLPGGRPGPRRRSHLLSPAGGTADGKKTAARSIFRVMFNEITKNAIQKAFREARQVNVNLVDAQQARRVLDRLVGYKISPLLWDKVRRGLSAGRVQTVALRLIVEREREIRAFLKREYWTRGRRSRRPRSRRCLRARLIKTTTRPAEIGIAGSRRRRGRRTRWRRLHRQVGGHAREEAQSGGAVHHLHAAAGVLAQAALQREAHHDAGAAALRRHRARQGRRGRPDHLHAHRFHARFRRRRCAKRAHYIAERYGPEFLPDAPNVYKSKKDAQDAHEAIRPDFHGVHAPRWSRSIWPKTR